MFFSVFLYITYNYDCFLSRHIPVRAQGRFVVDSMQTNVISPGAIFLWYALSCAAYPLPITWDIVGYNAYKAAMPVKVQYKSY